MPRSEGPGRGSEGAGPGRGCSRSPAATPWSFTSSMIRWRMVAGSLRSPPRSNFLPIPLERGMAVSALPVWGARSRTAFSAPRGRQEGGHLAAPLDSIRAAVDQRVEGPASAACRSGEAGARSSPSTADRSRRTGWPRGASLSPTARASTVAAPGSGADASMPRSAVCRSRPSSRATVEGNRNVLAGSRWGGRRRPSRRLRAIPGGSANTSRQLRRSASSAGRTGEEIHLGGDAGAALRHRAARGSGDVGEARSHLGEVVLAHVRDQPGGWTGSACPGSAPGARAWTAMHSATSASGGPSRNSITCDLDLLGRRGQATVGAIDRPLAAIRPGMIRAAVPVVFARVRMPAPRMRARAQAGHRALAADPVDEDPKRNRVQVRGVAALLDGPPRATPAARWTGSR